MALALFVATLAVAVGLALGLSPVVTRRVLGPSRSLALTAVVGVVVVHLVPEALSRLGAVGLVVLVAGLALPTLLRRLSGSSAGAHAEARGLELELGFWGLVVHQVGDGLALGAYSRVDLHSHRPHTDVLLALVLHTVPLIAVVAARYRREEGSASALQRCLVLAAASALGILATALVPPELVRQIQAWVAVGVAGLLLHALTHDMTDDLPTDTLDRALDLGAALLGLLLVWLGMRLDPHTLSASGAGLGRALLAVLEAVALPALLGIALGAWLEGLSTQAAPRARSALSLAQDDALSPESLSIGAVALGWPLALLRWFASWPPVRFSARTRMPVESGSSLLARFDARFDRATVWLAVAVTVAAVIDSSLPASALAFAERPWLPFVLVALVCFGVPLPGAAAPLIALALHRHGLGAAAAFFLALHGPLAARLAGARGALGLAWCLLLAWLAGLWLPLVPWLPPAPLGRAAAVALGALLLRRVYVRGVRGWLEPILPGH